MKKTSKPYFGAYRNGRTAAKEGKERAINYGRENGRWSAVRPYLAVFERYWLEGYDDQKAGLENRYTV